MLCARVRGVSAHRCRCPVSVPKPTAPFVSPPERSAETAKKATFNRDVPGSNNGATFTARRRQPCDRLSHEVNRVTPYRVAAGEAFEKRAQHGKASAWTEDGSVVAAEFFDRLPHAEGTSVRSGCRSRGVLSRGKDAEASSACAFHASDGQREWHRGRWMWSSGRTVRSACAAASAGKSGERDESAPCI
jgi:hypothetical protein